MAHWHGECIVCRSHESTEVTWEMGFLPFPPERVLVGLTREKLTFLPLPEAPASYEQQHLNIVKIAQVK